MSYLVIISFVILYVFCLNASFQSKHRVDKYLKVLCVILTIAIGFRGNWPDVDAYLLAFYGVPRVWDFHIDIASIAYVEKGYFFLASLVKTIYNNDVFYLLSMGAISMFLLYKSLTKYCTLPLIGLCDYIGRFLLNRDFTQMRSSLAILLIIISIKFIYERQMVKYCLVILLAYQFHHMALLGLPLYFLMMIRWEKSYIIMGLILAFVLSQTAAGLISGYVEEWSEDLQYVTYTQGDYVEQALGLRNPMIYFQIVILLLFTFNEKQLAPQNKYYEIFKVGYFYSTLLLIFFCNYTALSGRTSTLFATYEMFMLPLLAGVFPQNIRFAYWSGVGVVLVYFFYSKYMAAMAMMNM